MMAKCTFTGTITVSCYTVVEADTEEARKIAEARDNAGLCQPVLGRRVNASYLHVSKKLDNLKAACALYFAYCNFCPIQHCASRQR